MLAVEDGGLPRRDAESAHTGYVWYNIATSRPNDCQELWFTSGKDQQAAINVVYIDKIEFVRAE